MSPVPEPMHGGRQGPGGVEEEEDEGLTSPTGLPPVHVLPSSSDEELELSDPGNVPPGYQPLPHDFEVDDDDQENGVDYSSLSGLMSALATHGPNTVPDDEDEGAEATGTQEESEGRKRDVSTFAEESAQEWKAEVVKETAEVWNSNSPVPDRLQLDCGKVEQIKTAMASFTLPESAIPPWAQNLSDEEWKSQVSSLLARQGSQ